VGRTDSAKTQASISDWTAVHFDSNDMAVEDSAEVGATAERKIGASCNHHSDRSDGVSRPRHGSIHRLRLTSASTAAEEAR
jgi:hypothetical protein